MIINGKDLKGLKDFELLHEMLPVFQEAISNLDMTWFGSLIGTLVDVKTAQMGMTSGETIQYLTDLLEASKYVYKNFGQYSDDAGCFYPI